MLQADVYNYYTPATYRSCAPPRRFVADSCSKTADATSLWYNNPPRSARSLYPVYTIQPVINPVVKPVWQQVVSCKPSRNYFPIPSRIDIIWATMIVWRIRGKIITTVLCCVVYDICAEWDMHNMWAILKDVCWFRFRSSFCAFVWVKYFVCSSGLA